MEVGESTTLETGERVRLEVGKILSLDVVEIEKLPSPGNLCPNCNVLETMLTHTAELKT